MEVRLHKDAQPRYDLRRNELFYGVGELIPRDEDEARLRGYSLGGKVF